MKRFNKQTIIFLLATLILSFISPSYRHANASVIIPQPQDFIMESNTGKDGYIPSGVTIKKSTSPYKSSSLLPSKFDLRAYDYVTPVRDQGQIGDCWAFATFGSMESIIKKNTGISYDFSEINLAAQNGETTPDQGGNSYIATAYLTSWKGPVLETDDPYPNPPTVSNINSKSGLSPHYHVQDVVFLPGRTSSTDNDILKNAIYTYGAVSSSYYDSPSYYINKGQGTSFYYGTSTSGNHAITLVGWDDTYSRNNFSVTPPGDGAFLVKNSWGAAWGDNGYFYISYYDANLGHELNTVFNNLESVNNYKRMYSLYDKTYGSYYSATSSIDMAANVYTAQGSETISAVSFYTFAQNVPYKIYVQKVINNQIVEPTNLAASGTMTEAGYHTVKLSSGLSVASGDKFIIGVNLTGDEYDGTRNVSAANSYLFASGSPHASDLAFAIDAFSSDGAVSNSLSLIGEDPADGNLASNGTINLVFDDTIAKGTGFSNISLKDENNLEVSKNIAITGNKLSISETPQNHVGSLKLHIPKDALQGTRGQILSLDYDKSYTISADSVVVTFKDKAVESAVRQTLSLYSGDITAGNMKNITNLSLWNDKVFNLSGLEYAVNLNYLDCEGNNITDITPLSNLKKLKNLYLDNNYIQNISVLSGLTSLSELYIYNNKISDITPLGSLVNLTKLNMSNNLINDISPVQNLKYLVDFDFSGNYVSDITPLQTFSNNALGTDIYLTLTNNHIDFSQGSTAANVLSVLSSKGINYYGDFEQDQRLDPILAANLSPHSDNLTIGENQKIILSFNEDITLDPDFANLFEISGGSSTTSDYNYYVQGRNLIFIPKKLLTSDSYLTVQLYSNAVHSKQDTAISNNGHYYSFTIAPSLTGDIDGNSKVDILDISKIALSYNDKLNTAASWNPDLDLVRDGVINIYDLTSVSSYFN